MKMRTNKLKVFELYVLRMLSIQFILLGVGFLINKQWWIGVSIIIISFLFGTIGQGLKHNRQRTSKDLLKGQDWSIGEKADADSEAMTQEEGNLIGKPFLFTWFIVAITSILLLFHYDFKWYLTLPIAFFFGMFYPLLLFFLGVFLSGLTIKKNKK
jgi:hypothetical protein